MTDKKTEALKLALEALEYFYLYAEGRNEEKMADKTITAIREALAEESSGTEQQEPVACKSLCELCVKRGYNSCANAAQTTPIPVPQPAQQQEPVATDRGETTMSKQDEALKLALEALLSWGKGFPDNWGDLDTEAITAIREALAEKCVCGEPDTPGTHRTDGPCLAEQPAQQQEPGNWSVYNSGAEVASGLTFAEAWDYMTPDRLARQWCAVCVVDQSNLPTSPPASKPWVGLTEEDRLDIWKKSSSIDGAINATASKLREKNHG